ncbi:hypothetical protein ACQPZJ_35690 [Actinoplanes sp. CA-054009]
MEVIDDLRKTKTYAEIAETYGVTDNGVWRNLNRAGMTVRRRQYAVDIPWQIRKEHDNLMPLPVLRTKARRDAKWPIDKAAETRLNNFLKMLHDNDAVVGYDWDLGPDEPGKPRVSYGGKGGFFLAKRHPNDPPWPAVITYRDHKGRWRKFEDLHPENATAPGYGV